MDDDDKCPRLGDRVVIWSSYDSDQPQKQILTTNRPAHQTPIAFIWHFIKNRMRECLDEPVWVSCLHCRSLLLVTDEFERGNHTVRLSLAKPGKLFGRDYVWDVAQTMIWVGSSVQSLRKSGCIVFCHHFKVYPGFWGVTWRDTTKIYGKIVATAHYTQHHIGE